MRVRQDVVYLGPNYDCSHVQWSRFSLGLLKSPDLLRGIPQSVTQAYIGQCVTSLDLISRSD